MQPQYYSYDRLVKSEDLNHHRTLFAGRCAEWFVEAGFIAAASALPADNIVCIKIHGLSFTQPVRTGDITCFRSKIVHAGKTSLKVYVTLTLLGQEKNIVSGFITFVHVDQNGRAIPHGLSLDLSDPEDFRLNQQAVQLK